MSGAVARCREMCGQTVLAAGDFPTGPAFFLLFWQARLRMRCVRAQRRWSGVSGAAAVCPTTDPGVCGPRPGSGWGAQLYGALLPSCSGLHRQLGRVAGPAGCQTPLSLELHPLIHLPGIAALMVDLLLP
ncbi:hypothetical protein NDU88_000417 [Pleurodeles waltl]|uniref:Uncharacterized protein n=1 Tax=Pleurodeles waltl TaxID=8319 RepID=A0AAV7VU20_PLEWA|nr:hypothetical protein NDU88_000417 [Pleurodeles waltl]